MLTLGNESTLTLDRGSPSFSQSQLSEDSTVNPSNLKQTLSSENTMSLENGAFQNQAEVKGYRAAEAYVRPTPIFTHGDVSSYGFDLKNVKFTLTLSAPSSTPEDAPTEVFLPDFHFPPGSTIVEVTGGKWTISMDECERAPTQKLSWWHAEGDQKLSVTGNVKKQNAGAAVGEEDGYLQQYAKNVCLLM